MCAKIAFLFVLVYLIIPTEESVRHGFPPDLLHVNMDEELRSIRGPKIMTAEGFNLRRKRDIAEQSSPPPATASPQPAAATTTTTTPLPAILTEEDLTNNITIKANSLKDSHAQLMVHWLGDGSDVMICLARDPPLSPMEDPKKAPPLSPSSVFFSYDYGDTFVDKTKLFTININGTEVNSTLDQFSTHPKFDTIIFTDSRNKAIFNVPDKGDNVVKRYMVNFTPSDISFYEHDAKTYLVLDKEDPERKLYYTTDTGVSFSLLQEYVKSFSWSSGEGMPAHLYVERREPSNTSSVIFMNAPDLLKNTSTKEFHLLIENVQDFHVKKDFMFATRKVLNTTELWISYKRGKFIKAAFQTELNIKGLHIADVEGRRIMVSAAHSDVISHLYVSEGNADMTDIKFVPSLENVFTYIPNIMWTFGWLVQTTDEAFCDLYKVEGMRGIYIASKVIRSPSSRVRPEGSIGPEHLVSVISFDHGSSWRPIAAPKVDDEGQFINCTKECSLQLSQKFSQLYPVTRSVTIMSSKLAPGVIMASGVVGKSLKGHPGVFLSRDAGLTWKQILKNYHFFNFGDHGGILVAVKYFKSKGETHEILYSTDEGEKWVPQTFHTKDLKVYGLMTEPNTNTTIFTLFGSEPQEHRWLIIKIDLKNAFSYNCTAHDYKFWAPSSHSGDSLVPCILGVQQSFQRRVPHTNCFNGKDYERPVRSQICQCNNWDFECDFGFSRLNTNAPCIRNKTMAEFFDPYKIPKTCKPGDFYNRTRGYRKIEGDMCIDGYQNRYLPEQVPCPFDEVNNFLIVAQRDRITRIDLLDARKEVLPVNDLKNVIAIDFDMKHNCVFWADILSDTIGRQCLNGNQTPEILVETELASVEGMSYDWISELLFFVDGTRSKIEAVKTSNDSLARMRTTIIDSTHLMKPRGIVVHPIEGYLFWTEWSSTKPSLSRSNLDGSDITVLFTKPDVIWPNGVTIDYIAQRVYWVDAQKDYIASCDLNGKGLMKILQQDTRVAHPFAVAVFKDLMYWDDWKMNSVFSADKDHGIMISTVTDNMNSLMDLKIYAHSLQEGTNACSHGHNCTYICVGAPKGGYTCLCPEGTKKSAHSSECLCPGDLQPYENKTCPQLANTCGPGYFTCENKLCVPALYRCDGENDCGDNSDETGCSASRPPCPPHMFTCKKSSKCIPEYFVCDFDFDCDDGSDEDNCDFKKCKDTEFQCKNGRCISKKWQCDGEDDCRDASDEASCPSKNATAISCKLDEIRCKTNGQCIPNLWKCDNDYDCPDGSDEAECNIKECDMWEFNCGDGRCIYRTWRCDGDKDCVNGADEDNCTTTAAPPGAGGNFFPSVVCHDWMFKCGNNKCIPMWWKCDRVNDCGDGTDEYGCSNADNGTTIASTTSTPTESGRESCLLNQFQCDSGDCISKRAVCDGVADCARGEDERYCSPDSKVNCGHDLFRCHSDNVCLPITKHCDNVFNCADGSDEKDCNAPPNNSGNDYKVMCTAGYFSCDHTCLPLMKLCDNKQDCYDETDEDNCTPNFKRAYQANGLSVEDRTINETSFELTCWVTISAEAKIQLEFLPSITIAGINAWQNHTTWLTVKSHRFSNLKPYTAYNVTVYVRVKGEQPVPPFLFVTVHTSEGVPTEPLNVNVTQLNGSRVQVSWDPPRETFGELVTYIVYYRPQTVSASQAQSFKVPSQEHSLVLESYFKGNVTYAFWVRAKNSKHESTNSKMVHLTFDDVSNIDSLRNLYATNALNDSVVLKWQSIPAADGYLIQPQLMHPYPMITPLNTNKSEIKVTNMVAGVQYTFKVAAYVKSYVGRAQSVSVVLKGDPLPEVPQISLLHDFELIRLRWNEPKIKTKNITYGVYYGTTLLELFEKPRIITQSLSVNLTDLMPCESYLISVGIVGPVGPGPLGRSPLTLETSLNDVKPPKNLQAYIDPKKHTMTVTWDHNCPMAGSYPQYLISVAEMTRNKTVKVELKRTSNKTLSHYFNDVPYGAVYNISVSSNLRDAEAASIVVRAPELEGPRQLKVWPEKNGTYVVYWKELEGNFSFPFTYELVIFEGLWSNRSEPEPQIVNKLESKMPPILVNPEHLGGVEAAGKIFTLGVRLKSEKGFVSLISETEHIDVQVDSAWFSSVIPSTTYAWLVIIPIILVIALIVVVFYLVQRHKRLQNSFSRFANSHYDTKTGATRIGDTFDDDEHRTDSFPRFENENDDQVQLVIA